MARENGSRKSRNNSRCTQVAPYHVHLVTSPCLSTGHPTKLTQSMNKKVLFSEHKLVGFIINKLLGFSITTKHSTQNCCSSHQDLQVWLLVSCGFIFGFFLFIWWTKGGWLSQANSRCRCRLITTEGRGRRGACNVVVMVENLKWCAFSPSSAPGCGWRMGGCLHGWSMPVPPI